MSTCRNTHASHLKKILTKRTFPPKGLKPTYVVIGEQVKSRKSNEPGQARAQRHCPVVAADFFLPNENIIQKADPTPPL
jgi:hypothetical protein